MSQSFLNGVLTQNLRELRLINCTIPWTIPLLERLSLLELKTHRSDVTPSPSNLLHSLKNMPNVVDVSLAVETPVGVLPLLDDDPSSAARVALSSLQVLSLVLHLKDIGGLLSWLSIPPSAVVLLETVLAENPVELPTGLKLLWPTPQGIDLDSNPCQWKSAELIHEWILDAPLGTTIFRTFSTFATFDHFFDQESRAKSRQFSVSIENCFVATNEGIFDYMEDVITSIHPLREVASLSLKHAVSTYLGGFLDHFVSLQYIVLGEGVARSFINFLEDDPALRDTAGSRRHMELSLPQLSTIVFNRVGFASSFTGTSCSDDCGCRPIPLEELISVLVKRREREVSDSGLECILFSFCPDFSETMVRRMEMALESVDIHWNGSLHSLSKHFRYETACDECGVRWCPKTCQEPEDPPSWSWKTHII